MRLSRLPCGGRHSAALQLNNTINTAKVSDLGPGEAFLIEYHRGMSAVVRRDNRDATIKTLPTKKNHDGPCSTRLVFHSSVDLERFFRAMRCFSSSLFFSAPAKSIKKGEHKEGLPLAQKIVQIPPTSESTYQYLRSPAHGCRV